MNKIFESEIKSNVEVAPSVFKLEIDTPELATLAKAGQFVQIQLPSNEFTLRRPFGIASTKGGVKIFYRVVGRGTKFLSTLQKGTTLNLLAPLGNGFSMNANDKVLLVGGGMGLAPLLSVAEKIREAEVLIGGKTKSEVTFWIKEFSHLPAVDIIFVTTDDGSYRYGRKGFVTDYLPEILSAEKYSAVYTCGPDVMMYGVALEAIANGLNCEICFERRMACGLGACLSCSIETINGRKKVCKDGPVFDAREFIFNK
ncbi:MAG: dihydroorotate dehydrogenase electron transfer subunit [Selenomonadaceae bacterium]|nr:dihydroorotate dehydrogenase electron transfer subunit [Selenomonadaceae bacterium]